jgi:hypothetical protein
MAENGVVVDPWAHPSATPFGERAKSPRPGVPSAPPPRAAAARPSGPSVVPLGPPLSLHTSPGAVAPLSAAGHDDIVDPWAPSARLAGAQRSARLAGVRHNWSWEIQEIVDPWRRGPLAVATDPAIVDPWAPAAPWAP